MPRSGRAGGEQRGAGEVLLTSWDRDGTRSGYDLALTGPWSQAVRVPVIASGGADSAEHIREAFAAGADAVLAASIFHDGDITPATSSSTPGARHPGPAVIIPSIDLQGGQTVQLVGGAEKAIDAGDPLPIAERFASPARSRSSTSTPPCAPAAMPH